MSASQNPEAIPPENQGPGANPAPRPATIRIGDAEIVPSPDELPMSWFGDYVLLGKIAEGGMGVVFHARQISLNRTVALKMIRGGRLAGEEEIRRFHVEAQAVAQLDHPNIVPIYEIGEHQGHHYFSMKLVQGESLADLNAHCECRDTAWMHRAIESLVKVARAVQHAHERGILHRDLKPSNILLDSAGEPHVTDFGLAKLLDRPNDDTLSGAIMGTPHYMAPEQALGNTRGVTVAADVYSLGAVLFLLLTGHAPFKGETVGETLEKVRTAPAPKPSSQNPLVSRDLDTICLKCLEKRPPHRYPTAGALAKDLQRWLEHRPILARRVTPPERLAKWVQRNPRMVSVISLAIISLLVGGTIAGWQWRRAEHQRLQTWVLNTRLETQRAEEFFKRENPSLALAQLARVLRRDPTNHIAASRLLNSLNQRKFLVQVSAPLGKSVRFASLDSAGRLMTAEAEEQTNVVHLWRAERSNPERFSHGTERILAAACSRDGQLLATGTEKGARLWSTTTGAVITSIPFEQPVQALEFRAQVSNDIPILALVGTNSIMFWSADPRIVSKTLSFSNDAVVTAAFTTSRIALAMESGALILTQPNGHALQTVTNAHTNVIRSLRFGVNHQRLISASADGTAKLWDATTGDLMMVFPVRHALLDADLSRDGSRAVTAARDGTAQLWNTATGQRIGAAMPHLGAVNAARFSPDGALIVTGAEDGVARLWPGTMGELLAETVRAAQPIADVAFGEDGRWILRVADGGAAGLLACVGGKGAEPYPVPPSVLPAMPAELVKTPPSIDLSGFASARAAEVTFADLSTDGTLVAIGYADHTARIWNLATRQPLGDSLDHESRVNCVRFSSDGALLVTSTISRKIRVWDARTGQPLTDWFMATRPVSEVFLATNNKRVVTAEGEGWNILIAAGDAPDWLPDLAEAVAGVRYSATGVTEAVVGPALQEVHERLRQSPLTNPIVDWARSYLHELTFYPTR